MIDKNIILCVESDFCNEPDNLSLFTTLIGNSGVKEVITYHKDSSLLDYIVPSLELKRKETIIPIGNIPFVKKFYSCVYKINNITSFEIPKILWKRKDLIGRDYEIITGEQILNWYTDRTGNYCIKDVSDIKSYFHMGPLDDEETVKYITKYQNHQFSISEEVPDVISEWRVYSYDGKIKNVCHYDGNPLIYPNSRSLLELNKELNNVLYNSLKMSFSFDVMVTEWNKTYLIECHPHLCLGYYYQLTRWDSDDVLNAILQAHFSVIQKFQVW